MRRRCTGADPDAVTVNSSVRYLRDASVLMHLQARHSQFCSNQTYGTTNGEAWFGFGDNTLKAVAQRQFVKFDDATGIFVQPDGGSDTRYAPTNSCLYDG